MEQTQRTKLELPVNQPVTLQLLFDNPLTGENRYGPYYLYAFVDPSTGEEYSFFAPSPDVHEQLSHFNAGDNVTLLKSAKQNGRKILTEFSVTPANGGPLKSFLHDAPPVNGNGNGNDAGHTPPVNGNGNARGVNPSPTTKGDNLLELFIQCYADAEEVQKRFTGGSLSQIATTLFIQRSKTNGNGIAGAYTS